MGKSFSFSCLSNHSFTAGTSFIQNPSILNLPLGLVFVAGGGGGGGYERRRMKDEGGVMRGLSRGSRERVGRG